MSNLLFNTQRLRAKYGWAVAALPLGLMFVSFGPTWLIAESLAGVLGIADDVPVRTHPNGLTFMIASMLLMVVLMLLGVALGWWLNQVVARRWLDWTPEQIHAVFSRSEIPPHWMSPDAVTEADESAQFHASWRVKHERGLARFVMMYGVMGLGAFLLVVFYGFPMVRFGRAFDVAEFLLYVALFASAGAACTLILWWRNEASYRKRERLLAPTRN